MIKRFVSASSFSLLYHYKRTHLRDWSREARFSFGILDLNKKHGTSEYSKGNLRTKVGITNKFESQVLEVADIGEYEASAVAFLHASSLGLSAILADHPNRRVAHLRPEQVQDAQLQLWVFAIG